jgi:hypothetical protein
MYAKVVRYVVRQEWKQYSILEWSGCLEIGKHLGGRTLILARMPEIEVTKQQRNNNVGGRRKGHSSNRLPSPCSGNAIFGAFRLRITDRAW